MTEIMKIRVMNDYDFQKYVKRCRTKAKCKYTLINENMRILGHVS